ncbi:MAG: response regulator [Spirochaetes bacterium]|jgi:CheY-like chemotaxis protein|nr:response regulator [Spirochaetota bacterium]
MYSILVAEDEVGTAEIIRTILDDAGYTAVVCSDGNEAFEAYKNGAFALVLTDLNMPTIDGEELIRLIHTINEDQIIMVLSSIDDIDAIIDSMKAGVYDYIVKPTNKKKLIYKIHRALETSELKRIKRISEKERVVKLEHELQWYRWNETIIMRDYDRFDATLFSNLNDSFNQGSGFGTLISLLAFISDSVKEEKGSYTIDKGIYEMLLHNANSAKSILKTFTKISTILSETLNAEIIYCTELFDILLALKIEMKDMCNIHKNSLHLADNNELSETLQVHVHREYIKEVFRELLINSMKFSKPESKIYIFFQIKKNECWISFINTPSGNRKNINGIPEEYAATVFEPFYRIDKRVYDGYNTLDFGLGLTLADKIIRKHGGIVEIQNVEDYTNLKTEEILKVMVTVRLPLHQVTLNS